MTSRERVLTTFGHQQPDRCATFIWINQDAKEKLMAHVGVHTDTELEDELGIDHWRGVGLTEREPVNFAGRVERFVPQEFNARSDVCICRDGVVCRLHPDISYLEDVVRRPLQDVSSVHELDEYPFHTPDLLDEVTDGLRNQICELKNSDSVVEGGLTQPFKAAVRLRGMENFLCDFLTNPGLAHEIYERLYRFNTERGLRLAEAGVDVITIVGDIAMQDRLMMSPAVWREFDKPRLKRLIEAVKTRNPAVRVYMHSDGRMTDIVGDLVEIGLDILNPIQPECMDPFEIKRKWGSNLVLHGGVSLQRTIPLGTTDQVAAEVRRLVEVCGKDGGFVLGPANTLIVEFPIENIVAMYKAVTASCAV